MPTHAFDLKSDVILNDLTSQMTLDDLCVYCLKGHNASHCNDEMFAINYKTAKQLRLWWLKGKLSETKRKIHLDPNISSIPFDINQKLNSRLSDGQSGRGDFHGLTDFLNAGIMDSRDFLRRGQKSDKTTHLWIHI